MNLYKLFVDETRDGFVGYDEFDSMVVAAENGAQARELSNAHANQESWPEYTNIQIVLIGMAIPNTQPGVIVASYNAG